MRYFRLLLFHIRMLFHKNILNYLLFFVEIMLSVIFVSSFVALLFDEFNYKLNYLPDEVTDNYAVLGLHNALANELFYDENPAVYGQLIDELKLKDKVLDAGMVNEWRIKHDGFTVSVCWLDDCFADFALPTRRGQWLTQGNQCILGGEIAALYAVGDTVTVDNHSYTVIDHLTEPYYMIDSGIGGTLNIINVLMCMKSVILILPDEPQIGTYGSLLLRYDPSTTTPAMLQDTLVEFGTVYTFDDLEMAAKDVRGKVVKDNLVILLALGLICVLISTSGLLISLQNNRRNHAVMQLVGESKVKLLSYVVASQGILLFAAWGIGYLLAGTCVQSLFGIAALVPESRWLSLCLVGCMFLVNAVSAIAIYRKSALRTYKNQA